MILSYEHQFIFIKTTKTAGSSIEVALSKLCGDQDVVTMLTPSEAGHEPRNIASFRQLLPDVPADWPDEALAHLPGWIIRQAVPDLWSDYLSFVVERNPWERMVSAWHYQSATTGPTAFAMWLPKGLMLASDRRHYCDADGNVIVDRVMRFEHLDQEMSAVLGDLGLVYTGLGRSKGGYRARDDDYRSHYTPELKSIVARRFSWEIAHFGHSF